ncbi:MAG: relaxase domain-containing protein [Pleurocapsa sp. SU_5_0]|nr:relaxase domain-containing protein [Pleurocapsa sp. SU_5_0]
MVASVGRCYTNPQDYAQENYYTKGESFTNSKWLGLAANIQGLSGQINEKDFDNAYSSLDPNGNPLRKQQQYKKSSCRYNRPGTDVTLSAPKSVSVAALVYENQDILKAHKAAVSATMKYAENNCIFYQTKQRGQKLLLPSKTAQIAVFHHDDNRNKDPQLHSHCVILNQTQCPDGKWRAVANKELYKQQKTIGAYYDHELARQLQQLGYQVEWTSDHTLELAGVDREKLNAAFSSRSNQIEAELSSRGLTRATATAEQKQAICLKTRPEKKRSSHPQDRQKQLLEWQQKARENGIERNLPSEYHRDLFERTPNNPNPENNLKNLIGNATKILTERSTAFLPHELLRECLRQSQGRYEPEKIQNQIDLYQEFIQTRDGRLTTTETLSREQKIVQLTLSGRNSQIPLSNQSQVEAIARSRSLNQGQSAALKQMVTSRDTVVLIQGNAGVGKTYTMKALAQTVGDKQPIRGLAPSAAAANVLQNESDITSQTLASYLLTNNQQLPQQEIILVDEAGMLSTRKMEKLLEKAVSLNNRVILVGDTKQLSAVEAGAPFKLLQEAGLSSAIIDQNLRQRDPQLKQVVDLIANHEQNADSINQAYQKLNDRGKVKQITNDEVRRQEISSDYLSRPIKVRYKTLILAGTNADKQAIAQKVRQGLMVEGTLGNESLKIPTLKRKDIDRFAITCAHHYQRGDVIKFQTDSARFSKNSYYRVTEIDPEAKTVTLIDTLGLTETLPLNKYKQREIYTIQNQEIRPGERMRFTKNIRNSDHKQLNGQRFTVSGVTPDGQIEITSKGKTQKISVARLLHSDYSYVDTVHSSQGQTADYCIYSAARANSKTIGRESFYVAASRAKQEFVVYTKNAIDLGVTIQLSRKNENAHELVQSSDLPKNQEKSQGLDRHFQQTEETVQKSAFSSSANTSEEQQQQTTKAKSSPQNQSPQLNDVELINSLNRLSQWQKESPNKPNWNYGQSKHQQIERFKQEKDQLGKRLKLQELELEKMGKPRSLFNPFGVSADVIEDKQIEIARTRSRIYDLESQLRYVLPDFQRWQKQARAYLAWDEEKSTKQMRQLEKDFSAPQIKQRIERLNDVYAVYAAASYIVTQQGTESANGRYYQGKSYRIEQQDNKLIITHKNRDVLMLATDCREKGGIIQANQFNLTREDKKIIRDSARDLKQQIDRLQKSRQIERGGLSY